ncbi:MAG: hypothetical protein ACLGIK_15990, partial [Gemmatimonadota bacterium]
NYIGDVASATLEYRTELGLHDPLMCPAASHNSSHNDGAWVREFIWLTPTGDAPGQIQDAAAKVWSDFGGPNDEFHPSNNMVYPFPSGTFGYANDVWLGNQDENNTEGSVIGGEEEPQCVPSLRTVYYGDPDSPGGLVPYVTLVPTVREGAESLDVCADSVGLDPLCEICPRASDATSGTGELLPPLEGNDTRKKKSADMNLQFYGDTGLPDPSRQPGAAACLAGACKGWYSGQFTLMAPHLETGIQEGEMRVAPRARQAPAPLLTTYGTGDLGALGIRAPIQGGFGYGNHQCSGNAQNWSCDRGEWWGAAKVGDMYYTRDTDPIRIYDAGVLFEVDENGDMMGDVWQAAWDIIDYILDPDVDEANNLLEFQWRTVPLLPLYDAVDITPNDTDDDNWEDGPEIAYWDATNDSVAYLGAVAAG